MFEQNVVVLIEVPRREDNGIYVDPVRDGMSTLDILLQRMERVVPKSGIVVLTGKGPQFACFNRFVATRNLHQFASSEEHKLRRILAAVAIQRKNIIVRVSADNPFADPELIENMVTFHINKESDYTFCGNLPEWTCADVIRTDALQRAYDADRVGISNSMDPCDFFMKNNGDYQVNTFNSHVKGLSTRDYSLGTPHSASIVISTIHRIPDPVAARARDLPA